MSDIEKKLDALIDALGFDVEVNTAYTSIYKKKDVNCSGNPVNGAIPERMYEKTDYKLTKRNDPQRKYNLYMSALIEHQSGITSSEEFNEIIKGLL